MAIVDPWQKYTVSGSVRASAGGLGGTVTRNPADGRTGIDPLGKTPVIAGRR